MYTHPIPNKATLNELNLKLLEVLRNLIIRRPGQNYGYSTNTVVIHLLSNRLSPPFLNASSEP